MTVGSMLGHAVGHAGQDVSIKGVSRHIRPADRG